MLFHYFQVIDLTRVSQELAYLASDADLVILEGMVSSFSNKINAKKTMENRETDIDMVRYYLTSCWCDPCFY